MVFFSCSSAPLWRGCALNGRNFVFLEVHIENRDRYIGYQTVHMKNYYLRKKNKTEKERKETFSPLKYDLSSGKRELLHFTMSTQKPAKNIIRRRRRRSTIKTPSQGKEM